MMQLTRSHLLVLLLLLLPGLRIFINTQPDAVILEVGIGGRIDATNILRAPAVTGGALRSCWTAVRQCICPGAV
jgi:hypothetical protein